MTLAARLIGLCICALGIVAIAAPELPLNAVRYFQASSAILLYLAAAIRIVFGVVLVRAAAASRVPMILRVLGSIIVISGLLTPFFGAWGAQTVFDWWSAGGPGLVRSCAGLVLVIGVFIVYAVTPARRAA
jgi:hypothetical protein